MKHRDVLVQIRKLIAQIVDGKDAKATGQKALDLIDKLMSEERGRGEAEVEYIVENSVNGPVLTEKRKGGQKFPFRCPKSVYDAMVKVLAGLDRAVPLDELVAAVEVELGDRPPDYQVRVPLRLWMHLDPPLIARNRARYKASANFRSSATRCWVSLDSK